jgi:hypothetical protein
MGLHFPFTAHTENSLRSPVALTSTVPSSPSCLHSELDEPSWGSSLLVLCHETHGMADASGHSLVESDKPEWVAAPVAGAWLFRSSLTFLHLFFSAHMLASADASDRLGPADTAPPPQALWALWSRQGSGRPQQAHGLSPQTQSDSRRKHKCLSPFNAQGLGNLTAENNDLEVDFKNHILAY